MATAVRSSGMLARVETNRGLANFFTNTHVTPQQRHDLLQYRKLGQADFDAHMPFKNLPVARLQLVNESYQLLPPSELDPSETRSSKAMQSSSILA